MATITLTEPLEEPPARPPLGFGFTMFGYGGMYEIHGADDCLNSAADLHRTHMRAEPGVTLGALLEHIAAVELADPGEPEVRLCVCRCATTGESQRP